MLSAWSEASGDFVPPSGTPLFRQGEAGLPLRTPSSCPGRWGRLRHIASRLAATSGDLGEDQLTHSGRALACGDAWVPANEAPPSGTPSLRCKGGLRPPFRNPPLYLGCWGRLRRVASRPEPASGVSGRSTHTQGGAHDYGRPGIFLTGASGDFVPPSGTPLLIRDVGGAFGASLRA